MERQGRGAFKRQHGTKCSVGGDQIRESEWALQMHPLFLGQRTRGGEPQHSSGTSNDMWSPWASLGQPSPGVQGKPDHSVSGNKRQSSSRSGFNPMSGGGGERQRPKEGGSPAPGRPRRLPRQPLQGEASTLQQGKPVQVGPVGKPPAGGPRNCANSRATRRSLFLGPKEVAEPSSVTSPSVIEDNILPQWGPDSVTSPQARAVLENEAKEAKLSSPRPRAGVPDPSKKRRIQLQQACGLRG